MEDGVPVPPLLATVRVHLSLVAGCQTPKLCLEMRGWKVRKRERYQRKHIEYPTKKSET